MQDKKQIKTIKGQLLEVKETGSGTTKSGVNWKRYVYTIDSPTEGIIYLTGFKNAEKLVNKVVEAKYTLFTKDNATYSNLISMQELDETPAHIHAEEEVKDDIDTSEEDKRYNIKKIGEEPPAETKEKIQAPDWLFKLVFKATCNYLNANKLKYDEMFDKVFKKLWNKAVTTKSRYPYFKSY